MFCKDFMLFLAGVQDCSTPFLFQTKTYPADEAKEKKKKGFVLIFSTPLQF